MMLLLMQNMIPNCTLDEKQPIEKLFRTGNGNTTIHSLVEWKLDEQDRKEGYRYMTTGFCARKAKDVEGETVIIVRVPYAEIVKYTKDLRSITRGSGSYSIQLNGYEQAPTDVTKKLVEEYQASRAAGN